MDGITELLAERGKTHGDFEDHARIAQDLKAVIRNEDELRFLRGQRGLTDTQLESLEMICHKIGRIIAGDAGHQDHWDDIAGYAKLCSKPPAKLDDYDAPCPLDGRNCPPDHDHGPTTAPLHWSDNYVPSKPEPCSHSECTPVFGRINEKRCRWCGAVMPINLWASGEVRKHACICAKYDDGRCWVDRGFPVGNNVYCCKAEEGR